MPQVGRALYLLGRRPRPAERRQQDAHEDADDGDHHQQLDQGEGGRRPAAPHAVPNGE
jgi:hypothetical protein